MPHFSPKTMLITGGAGFIGSHFVLQMLQKHKNLKVINVDTLTYAASLDYFKGIENDNYLFKQLDICDREAIEALIRSHGRLRCPFCR